MKRIPSNINAYCTFCRSEGVDKVKAIWRLSYDHQNRACEKHKPELQKIEDDRRRLDGNYSEADYQTWLKL